MERKLIDETTSLNYEAETSHPMDYQAGDNSKKFFGNKNERKLLCNKLLVLVLLYVSFAVFHMTRQSWSMVMPKI